MTRLAPPIGRLWSQERGITGLETAIVLIAFVVVSSVFAFAALSTGLFSSDKAKESIQAGLAQTRGTLELRGGVRATATLTAVTAEAVGTGDAATTDFTLDNSPIIPGSQTLYVAAAAQTEGTHYSVNYDTGAVTFVTAPANLAAITADYTYYVITAARVSLSNAASGLAVDMTGGATIVNYMDADTIATNITNFSLTKYNADSDNLLEAGEIFELSVNTSTYGLTSGDSFILQIKPPSGAVIVVDRTIPANIGPNIDLG